MTTDSPYLDGRVDAPYQLVPDTYSTQQIGLDLGAVRAVAAVAAGLGEAEVRLLLELAARGERQPHFSFKASTRQLAMSTGLARSNVIKAIESLTAKRLIVSNKGNGGNSTAFMVSLLSVARMPAQGGPTVGPPSVEIGAKGGPTIGPLQFGVVCAGGPTVGPPPPSPGIGGGLTVGPPQNGKLFESQLDRSLAVELLQNSSDSSDLFDRITRARPSHFAAFDVSEVRRLVVGYMAKFGPDQGPPPGPDGIFLAQILTIASLRRFGLLIQELSHERRRCQAWGWFLVVALSRVHGLEWPKGQGKREPLRAVPPAAPLLSEMPSEQLTLSACEFSPVADAGIAASLGELAALKRFGVGR